VNILGLLGRLMKVFRARPGREYSRVNVHRFRHYMHLLDVSVAYSPETRENEKAIFIHLFGRHGLTDGR
jgi:hypothetical protein